MDGKEKGMTGTKYIYPCVSFESLSNFNFMDRFDVILKKILH